ncbi:MAG: hypothetical protein JWO57_3388 [Pseudonocardiales bacterium]|nr:hypothetical protein [Pseudonocardiales bacterium]
MRRGDRGSTIPLILGFFLVALAMTAGAVAAGDAFVQHRELQHVCDGAAAAGAASAVDLDRAAGLGDVRSLRFADVQLAVEGYLADDPSRSGVDVEAGLSADASTLILTCTQSRRVAFGAMFGKGHGIRHVATSSAQAPLS